MSTVTKIVQDVLGVELSSQQIAVLESLLQVRKMERRAERMVRRTGKDLGKIQLAPQAKLVLSAVPTEWVTMEQWADRADEAGLATRQGADRICAYYRAQLRDFGLIEVK